MEIPMEYIELGPVPSAESCAQVGSENYEASARLECAVFRRMLLRLFPIPEGFDVKYVIRRFSHEFGSYFEVCVGYDVIGPHGLNADVEDLAYALECNAPEQWDAIARYELAWFQRRDAFRDAVRQDRLGRHEVPAAYASAEPPALSPHAAFHEVLAAHPP
jgi:hypothetical protein